MSEQIVQILEGNDMVMDEQKRTLPILETLVTAFYKYELCAIDGKVPPLPENVRVLVENAEARIVELRKLKLKLEDVPK